MATLTPALFNQPDAYWQAALDIASGAQSEQSVPQMAKDMSYVIIQRWAEPKIFKSYGGSLAEAVGMSYRLAVAESWEDLDVPHARGLLESAFFALRQEHLAANAPAPVDLSDPRSRIFNATICLLGGHPAFRELFDYLLSRGASERLASVDTDLMRLNAVAAKPKRRDQEAFNGSNLKAWLIGRCLGMLAIIGEPPEPQHS